MGFFDGYNVSTSGMQAQRTRINIVSSNIANAQTTHSKDGGPYKKQNVVFKEILLNKQQPNNNGFATSTQNIAQNSQTPLMGVEVKEIKDAKGKPIMRYEPSHPDANKDGYVAYPNINPVIEMTDLLEALRSYEANLSAFQTQKTMDNKTLDILKG